MYPVLAHNIFDSTFYLSPERVIFWKERKALILADVHLGKTGHFRKSGIGVPVAIFKEDLHRLFNMLVYFKPEKLIVVGDMFHSRHNREFELFKKWRKDCESIAIELIKGNHDIVNHHWYSDAGIETFETRTYDNFTFVHDITASPNQTENRFTFSGHLHPAICLKGNSRQSLRFPCYYFNKQYGVLPAFSDFSGHYTIKPANEDSVFAIVNKSLIKITS